MSSVDLYVAVVGHVKRMDMATQLATEVAADELFMDDGFKGEWGNHEYAWRAAARSGKTHAVILQDDAVPIPDFREHAQRAAEERPDSLISLYTGTHRPRKEEVERAVRLAETKEASWLSADTLMWGVGVVVPVALIDEILDTVKISKLPYDQRIGLWAEKTQKLVYYTWPSLINHADEPTVIKGRPAKQGVRVAHKIGIPSWCNRVIHIDRPGSIIAVSQRDYSV